MTAYYNEIDPYCADWLRNLMREGLIADGQVDTRSIVDVTPNDLRGFTQCHFFAGLGGWSGALRLSGVWPDHRPIWTGSCPCQPFSLAGKQGGFDDQRHLWPAWQWLIAQCHPATILGEQVASAAQWLGLVRGDLEAMGYAVGAMPIQAASAGADHLRDRYWFVANSEGVNRGTRSQSTESTWHGNTFLGDYGNSGILAHADDAGSQGWRLLPERTGERAAGADGVADADQFGSRQERQQRSGEQRRAGGEQKPCAGYLDNSISDRWRTRRNDHIGHDRNQLAPTNQFAWVIGADGKARRVKPGIRLLAHGVPNRVAKLRALGNAIDLRPAAAFIKAVHESI